MTRAATEEDYMKSFDYAMDEMCKHKGYQLVHVPAGTLVDDYDEETKTISKVPLAEARNECRHTEETCRDASVYPSTEDATYLEWKDGNCIMGNEAFRTFCKDKNLDFDENTGLCRVNHTYCRSKEVGWENNDCNIGSGQGVAEFFFGTTITRGVDQGLSFLVGRCEHPPCQENEGCLQGKGDCADGLFCNAGSTCKRKLPENSHCSSNEACEDGLWCGDIPMKCHKPRDVGGYCPLDSIACKDNLFCNAWSKCEEKLDDGDTCSISTHCKSGNCGHGLSCLNSSGKALRGKNCSLGDDCMDGDYCNALGYCAEKLNNGDTCSISSHCKSNKCGHGLSCLDSSGKALRGKNCSLGDPCQDEDQCNNLGYCDVKQDDGASCLKNSNCKSGICGNSLTCLKSDGKVIYDGKCGAFVKDPCSGDQYCNTLGVCSTPSSHGGSCDILNAMSCKANLYCDVSSKCADKLNDGKTCSDSAHCKSGKCGKGLSCLNSDGKALRNKNCSLGDSCKSDDYCGAIGYCWEKLKRDKSCSENSHCKSGKCNRNRNSYWNPIKYCE